MPNFFIETKSVEIEFWFDNVVFDLVDIRKFKQEFRDWRWVVSVHQRDRDGKFQKCKARWVLRGFQDRQKHAQQTDSLRLHVPGVSIFLQNVASNVGPFNISTSRLRSSKGKFMHQIAMWSVNYLQTHENFGISHRDWKKPT